MHVHHFYPRTNNVGDHFVQRGIERMVRRIRPDATFELFNINSRGEDKVEYGLTRWAIERANREADVIVVGGSNLYEGSYGWRWGVHLEVDALEKLRVPLLLLGIGSGSNFASPLHRPSSRTKSEIKLLNNYARLSCARDVITLDWLQQLGITKARLAGDPATFIFNQPPQSKEQGYILITMPPRRFWTSKRQFWSVRLRGRAMFRSLVAVAKSLLAEGREVVVACNDPMDLQTAESLFAGLIAVVCPKTPEEYFELLSGSRAVISGRLHTAVVAFSLGVPFLLLDMDQRTHGFIKTYQLEPWSVVPSRHGLEDRLSELTAKLLDHESSRSWSVVIKRRDQIYAQAMNLLEEALP
jgi:polysaccharide pyruvyl transferase WcaK-like protein